MHFLAKNQSSWRGRVAHETALTEMRGLRREMIADRKQRGQLILCEHPPTITCGKHSHPQNVLFSQEERLRRGIELSTLERGGDVSYHGPGQLMVYPVVRVGVRVRAFLGEVARALGALAESYGVSGAEWRSDEAGLWLGDRKLAACGLHLERGVSIHGFAFNVSTDASDWECIVPCGLEGSLPISLCEAMGDGNGYPTVEECAGRAEELLAATLKPWIAESSVGPAQAGS